MCFHGFVHVNFLRKGNIFNCCVLGIEAKPGKPFTHYCEKSKGRLRISQATLGIGSTGDVTEKAFVQCSVGNQRPVLLCALLPNITESCHLELEFEEADDVTFSVIGPRSVYLTGYYLQKYHRNHQSDTESYGVDIENTQTEGCSFCSDDDKYDDSFIDDVELQVSPLAPGLSFKVDDTAHEKDTPNDRKRRGKQLRKRDQIQSDGGKHKTEDACGYLLSVPKSRRCLETILSNDTENIAQVLVELGQKAEDSGNCGSKPTEKVDPDLSDKPEREATMGSDDKGWVKVEKNEGPKTVQTPEKNLDNYKTNLDDDKVDGSKEATMINLRLPMSNEKECSQLLDSQKCAIFLLYALSCFLNYSYVHLTGYLYNCCLSGARDQYKAKTEKEKTFLQEEKKREFEIGNDQTVLGIKRVQEVESSINLIKGMNNFSQESKERTEELLKETSAGEIDGKCDNTPKDNESNMLCDGSTAKILLASNGEHQEQAADNQPKKNIKKKGKKKAQGKGNNDMDTMKMKSTQETMVMKYEDPQTEKVEQVKRTALSNGLIIEELAQGPPDGKIAAVGKKIKLFYTAMLKESGKVFDSNMGGTACSCRLGRLATASMLIVFLLLAKCEKMFVDLLIIAIYLCLGDEEFIDGWNIGIEGSYTCDEGLEVKEWEKRCHQTHGLCTTSIWSMSDDSPKVIYCLLLDSVH
ncbi:hypothetical protein F511_30172 [Dorcoceras hygrometricum]|uniref:peptidylprolyl isomerase n=1 Tax=Dorcoceras hygrometricum TaxID=472368 RepID=A0A2Z7CJV0_9LAMI|nr:hypothetical protein F511_30172 [Dorcoceras hygrometricum]